mmetsp:Transcript_39884/g.98618  ORF Transcript_39884/g.98618 Transcript_39884/m.98618 type:complete len:91 (+) Transcript_39884:24-296(+)
MRAPTATRTARAAGADVTQSVVEGATALMVASAQGHTECVRLLLEAGTVANHVDRQGRTALMGRANQSARASCSRPAPTRTLPMWMVTRR